MDTGVQGAVEMHRPVLLQAALDGLAVKPDGFYVDGTFGRGGHSAALLDRLGSGGRLLATDRDPQAVAVGRSGRFAADARFEMVHARFSELPALLAARGEADGQVDGVLLDLGVSSPQLDDAARGFSFRQDGPLDMRMDPTRGPSAREWLLQASENDIADILRTYGEERFAVQIAKAVVAGRTRDGDDAFRTTGQLATLVAGVVARRQKRPEPGKDPATRTFQALRIAVNQELEELSSFLDAATGLLKPGGRLAVISFHSLEDRMVKRFIARESGRVQEAAPVRAAHRALPRPDPVVRLQAVARVLPDHAECAANPRSRSAVLRVAERTLQA